MRPTTRPAAKHEFEDRLRRFQNLMTRRVQHLLLVASAYDSFILEEDGQLDELILNEFTELNLSTAPAMRQVTTGSEAIARLQDEPCDLVVTTGNLGDMSLETFIAKVHAMRPELPVVLLAFSTEQVPRTQRPDAEGGLAAAFVWQGDFRILLAIVKMIEDRWNVEADTQNLGVSVILLIEDSIRFYSSFLPVLYTRLMVQSQRVISEGMNLTHKVMRMRARPKILSFATYEDAWAAFEKYQRHLIGVVSDVEFPRNGERDREAGLDFARRARESIPDLPILLQTLDESVRKAAGPLRAEVALKNSATLLHTLDRFMLDNFGFGDFVFRREDGTETGRASDLRQLEEILPNIDDASILYHAERNHFSTWLKARTEFSLAEALRPVKASEFRAADEIRQYLLESIREFRRERQSGSTGLYDPDNFDPDVSLATIGAGSMGGKGRGLAFLRQLIYSYRIRNRIPGVRVVVPSAVVLTTEVFDQFMEQNELRGFALEDHSDDEMERRFVEARFPKRALNKLKKFLERADYPLAVRSSSLLEDSQYQPFAGIYSTLMIPNNNPDDRVRLRDLLNAVKCVYASTFSRAAKEYMATTPFRLEEEKMAVIVQRVVGAARDGRFYPEFAGVAQSYNFYPSAPATPEDGLVSVALGLGRQVVEGGKALRFCPRFPKHLPEFSTLKDVLKHAQRDFYAIDLAAEVDGPTSGLTAVRRYGLDAAAEDGALQWVGSVYVHQNGAIYDGLSREGTPVVTFAPVLKHSRFPLPEVTEMLLEFGRRGMNSPVFLEFAVNLSTPPGSPKEFACLQMRPFVHHREVEELVLEAVTHDEVVCWSNRVLGNGIIDGIRDIVVVDREKFDRADSRDAAMHVGELNARLVAARTPYILVGVGRWGASDPWLGIPVAWDQISGARVIVEAGFRDISVTPSQGSHFFHNLTSLAVGYFSVDFEMAEGFVDWDWLLGLPAAGEVGTVRHVRLDAPMRVKMRGAEGRGVIFKPGRGA